MPSRGNSIEASAVSLEHAELGLVGDVAQRAGLGAGAEQRALRAAQHLEAIEVEELEIGRKQRDRNRRLIEVHAHLLLHARLVANHLPGADAADRDLALARAEVRNRQSRDIARQIDDVFSARVDDLILRFGSDRERNVLQRGAAQLRGHHDLLQSWLLACICGRCDAGGGHGSDADTDSGKVYMHFHESPV